MDAKTSWKVSCVPMCSLPCEHHNKWMHKDQWDGCKHNEWGMWLKDGAIQVKFVRWWKRLLMIGKTWIELIKLWAKHHNRFEHERMQTWWTSNIPSERMLKKIAWYTSFENGMLKPFNLFVN
jgi:hypothetical protein